MLDIVRNFDVRLKNYSNDVYYSGETIEGHVSLILNEPLHLNGVRFSITGKAHTEWTEKRIISQTNMSAQVHSNTFVDTYKDDEEYIKHEAILWAKGKKQGANEVVLFQPGSYEFPFSFAIPTSCPSSFEGANGFIRYLCQAALESGKFVHKCTLPFTVVSKVDLNKEQGASRPIKDFIIKPIRSSLIGKTGKLECKIDLDRSGFVPGETIVFNLHLQNDSKLPIDSVEVKLEEITVYTIRHRDTKVTHCSTRTVAQLTHGRVDLDQRLDWVNQCLVVPSIASTLRNSNIIEGVYELQFKAFRNKTSTVLKCCFPIIIGNIPLWSMVHMQNPKGVVIEPLRTSPHREKSSEKLEMKTFHNDSATPQNPCPPVQPSYQVGHFPCSCINDTSPRWSGAHGVTVLKYTPRYPVYDIRPALTTPEKKDIQKLKYDA